MKKTILIACALMLAAPMPLAAQTTTDVNGDPTGEGNPNDVTCRTPQIIPGTRKRGPKVCKTNVVWAQYREDGMTVAADGTHDIPVAQGKKCQSQGGSIRGPGATVTCE